MREMQETLAQSPCWEDPLKEGMASHSSILAWKSHGQRSLAGYSLGPQESDTTEQLSREHGTRVVMLTQPHII